MRRSIAAFSFAMTAWATTASPPPPSLSVAEVIKGSGALLGKRALVHGRISECGYWSCGLSGVDGAGQIRHLSLGGGAEFDRSVRGLAGKTVLIEATITDICMPNPDANIMVVCTDRPPTLDDPIFKSVVRTN